MSRRALLVAESGGHLDQLLRLESRFRPDFDSTVFVTSPTDQSRAMLTGRDVRFVPRVPPRGLVVAGRAFGPALQVIRSERITDVISTGSAIAVPYLMAARTLGRAAHYVESATRTHGPSATGRILSNIPGVQLYTQHRRWANRTWQYHGSVFDGFRVHERDDTTRIRRVVVTLGTMRQYPYERAVAAIHRILGQANFSNLDILWQIGMDASLPGRVRISVPADELRHAIAEADLVIAHAGTGSALQILDAGRVPVLLPRSASRGEHVDDHQHLLAKELSSRGLAVTVDPDDLTAEHLRVAASQVAVSDTQAGQFELLDT